ncbi:MAG: tetratricopeptide repeat protein [Candidatus Obscuribacter sp.]|nr:tetratricopeptide repeat protein [Candidatus Obscuribacter sp.]
MSNYSNKHKSTSNRKYADLLRDLNGPEEIDSALYVSYKDRSLTGYNQDQANEYSVTHAEFLDNLKNMVDQSTTSTITINSKASDERDQKLEQITLDQILPIEKQRELAHLIYSFKPGQTKPITSLNSIGDVAPYAVTSPAAEAVAPAPRPAKKSDSRTALPAIPLNTPAPAPIKWRLPLRVIGISTAILAVTGICASLYLDALSRGTTHKADELYSQGEFQQSLQAASQAVSLNPFSSTSQYARGRALVSLMRYREAEDCFNKGLFFAPMDKQILDARAAASLKINKPEQTIADTRKLMTITKEELQPYQYGNLAAAYYKKGQPDEALKYYALALQHDPANVALYLGRGYCLASKAQFSEALSLCNTVVNLFPENYEVLALRGYCRQMLKDLSGAAKDLNLAVNNAPDCSRGYRYRASLRMQLHMPSQALSDYLKLADLERDSAETQQTAAKMLMEAGQKQKALQYYNRLALLPGFRKSVNSLSERAQVNFDLGNYPEATSDLKLAVEQKPEAKLYSLMALSLAHQGDASAARDAMQKATQADSNLNSLNLTRARMENLLGQSITAIDRYTEYLVKNPSDKQALTERSALYMQRKQWASAASDLKAAIALGQEQSAIKNDLAKCQSIMSQTAKVSLDLPKQVIINFDKMDTATVNKNAMSAYNSDDMQIAAIYLDELVKRQPDNVRARQYLAHSQAKCGNHDQAVANFGTLHAMGALTVSDKIAYASSLSASGLSHDAVAIMSEAHQSQPANADVTVALARLLSASGKIDQAMALCKASMHQTNAQAAQQLSHLYQSLTTQKQRALEKPGEASAPASTEG